MMKLVLTCEAEDRRYEITTVKTFRDWLRVECHMAKKGKDGFGWYPWEIRARFEYDAWPVFTYFSRDFKEWNDHFELCKFTVEAFEFISKKFGNDVSKGVYHEWEYNWFEVN